MLQAKLSPWVAPISWPVQRTRFFAVPIAAHKKPVKVPFEYPQLTGSEVARLQLPVAGAGLGVVRAYARVVFSNCERGKWALSPWGHTQPHPYMPSCVLQLVTLSTHTHPRPHPPSPFMLCQRVRVRMGEGCHHDLFDRPK